MNNMKTFRFIGTGLLVALFCFTLVSCDKDEEEESNLIETLKKHKWTYKYVDDFTDTSYGGYYETSTYNFYFLDNNIGYQYDVYTDHDSYFGTETTRWFGKFTYSISDNTINIRYTDNGNKTSFEYVSGYLAQNGDYYTPKVMTQSDRDFLNNQIKQLGDENVDKELELDLYDNIDELITVTGEFIEEDLTYKFNIKCDGLFNKYPQKYHEFTFGAELKYSNNYKNNGDGLRKYTLDMSEKNKTYIISVFIDDGMYMSVYNNIRAKIDRGESLTESEKDLFHSIIRDLVESLSSIEIRVFIEWDGEEFDIYEDCFSANIEFDSSCEVPKDNNKEDFSYTGIIQGHEYVDLGLSVKWATCNVGASSPEDYGDYYAWGETEVKSNYSWSTYKYYTNTDGDLVVDDDELQSIGSEISGTRYDVAYVKWGTSWRMPTRTEYKELFNNCKWTRTTQVGYIGYKVTGPNGNSIFLPAAGYRVGSSHKDAGEMGSYWSSTTNENKDRYTYNLKFWGYSDRSVSWEIYYYGQSIRPVTE